MTVPFNYDSYREIAFFLEGRGLMLNKRFGQNFLINRGAREKILGYVDPHAGERIWEIGPGIGAMTSMLLERGVGLSVFEIDRGFVRVLNDLFGDVPGFRIFEGDVLDTWKEARSSHGTPDKILGNLPYNAASAIIFDFIHENVPCCKMVYTVQKEAAQRMAAAPGSPSYSSFSIICSFAHDVYVRGDLRAGSFYPAPEVTSSIVELVPSQEKPAPADRELFFSLVHGLFTARRKTIKNNLQSWTKTGAVPFSLALDALEEEGIDPTARGETIAPERVVRLSNGIRRRLDELTAAGSDVT